ncbi:class I SAM-dependent methyltransferase [Streptomyces rishiriensis]|uniref:SAM-dependent methyltransferase n=1 Tax=Streptomyces rishiriensis TaxID=68264 RepID=A0ABU0P2N6_STRRH|nr:class I SAM-dependent methyltransferase [Streptomyces rishiriensis]MDQ0585663.1 SAM-dependent methyltransferase [Streptomyces rishiriensis]
MANWKLDGELHQQRRVAESYGIDAERYDRTRPRYPDALVNRMARSCPGLELLNVGAGTGIEARQFQAVGCSVLGVEPDTRMAEFARAKGTEIEVARFEEWEPAGRRFDGIISGQAWHWVDPVAGAAKAASVLRPGGRLAAFWNVSQPPEEVRDAFREVYVEVVPDALATRAYSMPTPPPSASPLLTKTIEGIRQVDGFGEPEQWQFEWQYTYSKDEWLDQLPTQGDHGQFPPEKLDRVLAGVGAAIDAMGGSFDMKYTAVAVTATLPTP